MERARRKPKLRQAVDEVFSFNRDGVDSAACLANKFAAKGLRPPSPPARTPIPHVRSVCV